MLICRGQGTHFSWGTDSLCHGHTRPPLRTPLRPARACVFMPPGRANTHPAWSHWAFSVTLCLRGVAGFCSESIFAGSSQPCSQRRQSAGPCQCPLQALALPGKHCRLVGGAGGLSSFPTLWNSVRESAASASTLRAPFGPGVSSEGRFYVLTYGVGFTCCRTVQISFCSCLFRFWGLSHLSSILCGSAQTRLQCPQQQLVPAASPVPADMCDLGLFSTSSLSSCLVFSLLS